MKVKSFNKSSFFATLVFSLIFFGIACNEKIGINKSNEFRNKLAGNWQIYRMRNVIINLDTTLAAYTNSFSIPTVYDQTSKNDFCLLNLFGGISQLKLQAFVDEKNRPNFISITDTEGETSPNYKGELTGVWDIKNYSEGEYMQFYRYYKQNGKLIEIIIDLKFEK